MYKNIRLRAVIRLDEAYEGGVGDECELTTLNYREATTRHVHTFMSFIQQRTKALCQIKPLYSTDSEGTNTKCAGKC